MIVFNLICCLAFLYFAYLNLNDPDAWLWVTIYLFAAACCGLAVFHYYFPVAYIIAIAFYLLYAIILFFTKDGVWDWITRHKAENIAASMQASTPWIEKTREFFGLLIISAALLVNYFVYR
jgi:Transmembrane family 220, helix